MSPRRYSRRDALGLIAATGALSSVGLPSAAQAPGPSPTSLVERHDASVRALLESQITDSSSPWCGSVADGFGLHSAGSAGSVAETLAAAFVHPA